MNKTLKVLSVLFLSSLVIAACNKDDDNPEPADVIASFQYEISAENWSDVVFTNYSQNASTYAWDFGDGNTSTEEGPTHSYAAGGTYEVMLTATGEAGTASKSETINVVNPNTAQQFLTGTDGKVWYLDREEIALGIGPGIW
jgi:PKD repeat protein